MTNGHISALVLERCNKRNRLTIHAAVTKCQRLQDPLSATFCISRILWLLPLGVSEMTPLWCWQALLVLSCHINVQEYDYENTLLLSAIPHSRRTHTHSDTHTHTHSDTHSVTHTHTHMRTRYYYQQYHTQEEHTHTDNKHTHTSCTHQINWQ